MAATITTKEIFPLETSDSDLDELINLRIQAGAIRCYRKVEGNSKVIYTEWNVIGAND